MIRVRAEAGKNISNAAAEIKAVQPAEMKKSGK